MVFLRASYFYFSFEMIFIMPDHAMMIKIITTGMNVSCTKHIGSILSKLQQDIAIAKA